MVAFHSFIAFEWFWFDPSPSLVIVIDGPFIPSASSSALAARSVRSDFSAPWGPPPIFGARGAPSKLLYTLKKRLWKPRHPWFLHEFYLRRKVFQVFDSDNPRFLLQKRNINPWWYMICRWFANNWTAALKRLFTFWIFVWWLRVLKQNPSSRESFTVAVFEPRRRRISSRKSCTCRCGAEAVSNMFFWLVVLTILKIISQLGRIIP